VPGWRESNGLQSGGWYGPSHGYQLEWYAAAQAQALSFAAMEVKLSRLIRAPIEEVFAYFDDPAHMVQVNEHAGRFEVVDAQPDGRRTYDVTMRAGSREWMQTTEQVVREPPTRLMTRGGSWTSDRRHWLLTVTTDRRFSIEGDGTRVDVIIEARLDRPYRRPVQALRNWLYRGAARAEFEHQLAAIAALIEGVPAPDRTHDHRAPA